MDKAEELQILAGTGMHCHKERVLVRAEQRRTFANEFVIHFNTALAAKKAGYGKGHFRLLLDPQHIPVQTLIKEKLAERERESVLKAEYVREYIKTVLEFSPMDFFEPCPEGGGWMIAPGAYEKIPASIKRLVENVELRTVRTPSGVVTFLSIKFISKTAALAMAARYTLTLPEDAAADTRVLPWDDIARSLEKEAAPSVSLQLRAFDERGTAAAEGPAAAG